MHEDELTDLGFRHTWLQDPAIVTACRKAKHKTLERFVDQRGQVKLVICIECMYKYFIDLSN